MTRSACRAAGSNLVPTYGTRPSGLLTRLGAACRQFKLIINSLYKRGLDLYLHFSRPLPSPLLFSAQEAIDFQRP